MRVTAHKWGNSWAIRLRKKDLERLGLTLHEGKHLDIEVREPQKKWDVSMLPVFRGGGPMTFKQVREQAWRERADERLARR